MVGYTSDANRIGFNTKTYMSTSLGKDLTDKTDGIFAKLESGINDLEVS